QASGSSLVVGLIGSIISGSGTFTTLSGGTLQGSDNSSDRIWFCTENTTIASGHTFNGGSTMMRVAGNFEMSGGNFTMTSGTFEVAPYCNFTAAFTFNDGTFSAPNGSTLNMFPDANILPTTLSVNGNMTVYNLAIGGIYNTSLSINGNSGDTLTVTNNLTLVGAGLASNYTVEGLTVKVKGNITSSGTFYPVRPGGGSGNVMLAGTSNQTISAYPWHFPTMRINKTTGTVKLAGNNVIKNALQLVSATVLDLDDYTLTLGTDVSAPGTLTYTDGWLYNGTFERWFSTGTISIPAVAGLFPVGSATEYCPLWVGFSSSLTSGGTISVKFAYESGTAANYFVDPTWNSGTTIEAVTNSNWKVSTANGLVADGSSISLRYGGGTTSFGSNIASELAAVLQNAVVGTHSASTSSAAVPYEVNRVGLSLADLNGGGFQRFRMATSNSASSPMPIELSFFIGLQVGETIKLEWQTETEFQNQWFVIEKSDATGNFHAIDSLPGAGTSTQPIFYSRVDKEPAEGPNYYRLRQVDVGGAQTYSSIVAANFEVANPLSEISLYPNPAKDVMMVSVLSTQKAIATISIFSMTNIKIKESQYQLEAGNQTIPVDISDLKSSMYVLSVASGAEPTKQIMFIKE
ncbi:MAG TPA: T9SS type A sorting domain-containing protein, partial [Bacteroidia bacterium]|nr:T9SS type A sorting domain-containing protein [Bacteroidia bacterium]